MAPGAGRALPAGHCLSSVHVLVRSKRPDQHCQKQSESCSELWWWILLLLLLLVLVLTLLLAVVVVVVVVVIGRR